MKKALVTLLGCALAFSAHTESLRYEPAVVQFVGTLESGEGKDPEGALVHYPALKLQASVRVVADPADELKKTEDEVALVQLILSERLMTEYVAMKGRTVAATGTLVHSHTGHHYTAVLMTVQKFESAEGQRPGTRPQT